MRLQPSILKVDGAPGTPFKVEVIIDGAINLGAFEFHISFDPNFAKLVGIRVGPFLGSTGRPVVCQRTTIDQTTEKLGCNTQDPTPPGPDGSGVLASLDFAVQGQAVVTTHLLLASCKAGDVAGNALPLSGCKDVKLTINPTPTPTSSPTPTPTPPLRMQKLPPLQNLFLTSQGGKLPPATCSAATDVATLTEALSLPVSAPDPKDPSRTQQLGGFSFEVRFVAKQVCVELRRGPAAAKMICTIQDAVTQPTLQGIARMVCVTLGKPAFPDTSTPQGRQLAQLLVRPQPELYSTLRANQGNGHVVQLLNQGCKLSDQQGHPIATIGCDDSDLTIRYLEGDVSPNCSVDAGDTQAIAFRWGAVKGDLRFGDRFDLMPSQATGFIGDGRMDINDLQFVYGRFGSTCTAQWPAQPPVNGKG